MQQTHEIEGGGKTARVGESSGLTGEQTEGGRGKMAGRGREGESKQGKAGCGGGKREEEVRASRGEPRSGVGRERR